jgi:hypothetical protein
MVMDPGTGTGVGHEQTTPDAGLDTLFRGNLSEAM